jgi:S1-C subfamily serine protease
MTNELIPCAPTAPDTQLAGAAKELEHQVSICLPRRYLAFLGCCAFVGGILAALAIQLAQAARAQADGARSGPFDVLQLSDRFESIARQMSPAVVYVEAAKTARTGKSQSLEESGSGVIVRWPGQPTPLVLTNNHVISQATMDHITVNLADGKLLRPNRVWTDPETDVAVLRVDGGSELPSAILGDSNQVRVGQWVLAFGSPFGLNQTVTHGIISARERGQVSLGGTIRIKDFLQTDAAINPGSSGGPLVDMRGEVIGINTAIASHSGSNSGVAFSIPANLVRRVVTQLLEKGSVSRGYLGIQMMPAFEPADALRLGLDRVQGAWVENVYAGTPAADAGLRAQDVILQVDAVSIRNENHFINYISTLPAGQRVELQVWREGKRANLTAVVGDWSRSRSRFKQDQ